jgi:UDP-N-acetylglucosamine diphosphorylase/glucosamine-1-phosphate N-acetyltransferase
MRVCLFEDRGARDLEPLTQTRPAFDLICGASTLAEQLTAAFPEAELGLIVRPELADLVKHERPGVPVNDAAWLRAGPVSLVNGRWLPPHKMPQSLICTDGTCVGRVGDEIAFAAVQPQHLCEDLPDCLDDGLDHLLASLPAVDAGGVVIRRPWELVERNAEQLRKQFADRVPPRLGPWSRLGWRPEGTIVLGSAEQLLIDAAARIEPQVVFDTTQGPVTIAAGAVVQAFSRIDGPCHIGAGTYVFGGTKVRGGVTLGPHCRVGGEVESSIVQGYTNKYHDGFLGHSYLGEWINIGAGAQISDLRHDYGEVWVPARGEAVRSGRAKIGCFLGDHVKVGIGSLLNSGTIAGAFGQFLPAGRLLPKEVPAFCTTSFDGLAPRGDLDSVLATAERVMRRRGCDLTPAHASVYRALYAATAGERRRALRDADVRRLRRTA